MKNWSFLPISRLISKTTQDTAIVTMEDERDLSNGDIPMTLNDIE